MICGLPLLDAVYGRLGPVAIALAATDGDRATRGQVLATVDGEARTLLAGERLVLNFIQHLSGIATATRACVDRVAGTKLVIRDTRKTVPGMRLLAKYAVRVGGGTNHRLRLDDAILIKDNHITLGGGDVSGAVRKARAAFPGLPLEVECRTLEEVTAAIGSSPDLILLDNMTPATIAQAVQLVAGRVPLEASGGIHLDDLPAIAATGVDFVALGAITHSAGAVDLNLKIEPLG